MLVVRKSSFAVNIFDMFDSGNFGTVGFLVGLDTEMVHRHEVFPSFSSQPQVQGSIVTGKFFLPIYRVRTRDFGHFTQ
jgi:hypothetical protein